MGGDSEVYNQALILPGKHTSNFSIFYIDLKKQIASLVKFLLNLAIARLRVLGGTG